MGKHFTDVERINFVKKWRISGLPVKTFADQNGLNRETSREWANAYRDLEGRFIKINVDDINPTPNTASSDSGYDYEYPY